MTKNFLRHAGRRRGDAAEAEYAATSAITRNISAQYNIVDSLRFVGQRGRHPWVPRGSRQPPPPQGVCSKSLMNKANGALMERELTPVEARSGVVSGRVLTVLALSSVGAVIALALAWLFLFPR
jgi:hypothetical protein